MRNGVLLQRIEEDKNAKPSPLYMKPFPSKPYKVKKTIKNIFLLKIINNTYL